MKVLMDDGNYLWAKSNQMKVDWKGVYPAVTTKFTDDDQLDIPAIEKNIEAQIDAGVHGIVLGGTLGEASSLSNEEKQTIVSTTLGVSKGRVPVIINVAESRTSEAIRFVKEAEQIGADGFMALPPMRYMADDRETVQWFKTIANATDLPIMIYNNPVDYKIEVTLDMFSELAECSNIQAVKESTRDVSNVTRMKNRFGNRFSILTGVDTLAFESLALGCDGWVAGLVCAFPAETVAIYELMKQGRTKEALDIYRWFLPLLELDINAKLVQNIKLAEVATRIGTENVRAPRLPLVGEERTRVLKIIDEGMKNRPLLPELNLTEKIAY
ncbi:MAG: 4-hydroxy-tetrahydrodipicolinate synthase [Granulosicoccus sp.]|jgi:4-hydroxy-tetrahydrodipicolinate synthase